MAGTKPSPAPTTKVRKKFMLKPHIITRLKAKARREHASQNAILLESVLKALEAYRRENLYIHAFLSKNAYYEALRGSNGHIR